MAIPQPLKARIARWRFSRFLAIVFLMASFPALSGELEEYPVLTHADYEAATGCDVAIELYEQSLRIALTFLIFEESADDAHYVRRHSRDALMPMFASQEAGGSCLHPTIEQIGSAVGFPGAEEDSWQALQPVRDPGRVKVTPYLMTSRAEFMQRTGCLVSQSTYDHFRVAFFAHVLSTGDSYDAAARMRTFLRETGEGRHSDDGFLEPTCMTPTMKRMANELNLIADEQRQHLVSGDFNGDGYLDAAYASVRGEDDWNLVVQLDVLGDDGEIFVLDEHTPSMPVDEIKLEVMPRGEYTTFCGLAPGECEADAPHKIVLTSDAIYLIVLEASASVIYWDSKSESFMRIWLSD